jgi:hypothetical protein
MTSGRPKFSRIVEILSQFLSSFSKKQMRKTKGGKAKARIVCYLDRETGDLRHAFRGVPGRDPERVSDVSRLRVLVGEEERGGSAPRVGRPDDMSAFQGEIPSAFEPSETESVNGTKTGHILGFNMDEEDTLGLFSHPDGGEENFYEFPYELIQSNPYEFGDSSLDFNDNSIRWIG